MNQQNGNRGSSDPYEPGEVAKALEQSSLKDAVVAAAMAASWNSFKAASIIIVPTAIFICVQYGARASLFLAAFVYCLWVGSAALVGAVRAASRSDKPEIATQEKLRL